MKHSLRTIAIGVFSCAQLAACAPSVPQQPAADSLVKLEVAYVPSNPSAVGYLVRPLKPGKLPAVILIHEQWGLNDNMKSLADAFAAEGYVALAVDLYDGKQAANLDEAKVLADGVRADTGKALANLKAAVAYLKGSPSADPARLAAVGWGLGGDWSYQMAKNDLGVKASVMYYGQFAANDDLTKMKAHVLGHFGEKDASVSETAVKEFQAKLKTLSDENEVFLYPNAGNGFANENDATYDKAQADQALVRTKEFLSKQL